MTHRDHTVSAVPKHFTKPQLLSLIIDANVQVAEINRGGGKTERIAAPWLMNRAFRMPRSKVGIYTPSYKKLFTELIPTVISGWNDLGYIEDKHYVVGKRGPAKWEKPHMSPEDWTRSIHVSCGSAFQTISDALSTTGAGLSLDALLVEEARMINGAGFMRRVRQTLRGNRQYFRHLSCHHSLLIITDKGETAKQRWYQRFKEDVNEEQIQWILRLYHQRQTKRDAILSGHLSPRSVADYQSEIERIEATLNDLRKTATHYNTGTAIDTIEFIGWENFLNMEQTMDPADFARSMMNEDVDYVVGAWYSGFNADRHCYRPEATGFTRSKGISTSPDFALDSRHDAEINPDAPLDIALDYGGRFNCMAVGQMFKDLLRIDRGFHRFHPDTTDVLVQSFCDYYKHHRRREVYYYWDHTAKDPHGTSRYRYYEVVLNTLRQNGWVVHSIDIGRVPDPEVRYEMFVNIFKSDPPTVMWNPDGCKDMLTAMKLTRIQEGYKGFRKNKDAEKHDQSLDSQVHAPHYGDAVDTLVWGRFQALGTHTTPPIGSLFTR